MISRHNHIETEAGPKFQESNQPRVAQITQTAFALSTYGGTLYLLSWLCCSYGDRLVHMSTESLR